MVEVQEVLRALVEEIRGSVSRAVSNKAAQPEDQLLFHWKAGHFKYTDHGVECGHEGDYITRKTWLKASANIWKEVSARPAYTTALRELGRAYPADMEMPKHLEIFTYSIIRLCFGEGGDGPDAEIDNIIDRFSRDLAGEPIAYKAEMQLQGIALRPERILLDVGVTIRQPVTEDLELTVHAVPFGSQDQPRPSAIVDIEVLAGKGQQRLLQTKAEECVALLRLFKVGSVRWVTLDMKSESLAHSGLLPARMGSGSGLASLDTCLITEDDKDKLKAFWRVMGAALPKDIYSSPKEVSHLTLAYDRYSDALLQNGVVERRIANAAMGLEALWLDEMQELSFRLSLRVSKLLSLMGKQPLEVRGVINDAYRIRSTFAHGGHLEYKNKKKLESKYGEVKEILHRVLDYLRVSIIAMVLCRKGKHEFIGLIDDALLDPEKNEELKTLIGPASRLLSNSLPNLAS
jgi:hypothetical protein